MATPHRPLTDSVSPPLDELRAKIDSGMAQLDRGEGIDGEAFMDGLLEELDSPETVKRAARRQETEVMREQIEEGAAAAERGEVVDGEEFFKQLLRELDED